MNEYDFVANPLYGPQFLPGSFSGGGDFNTVSPNALASLGLQYQPLQSLNPGQNLGYGGSVLPDAFAPPAAMLVNNYLGGQGFIGTNPFGSLPNLGPVMRNRAEMMQSYRAVQLAHASAASITRTRLQAVGTNFARLSADPGTSEQEIQQYGQQYGEFLNNTVTSPFGAMGLNMLGQATGIDLAGVLDPTGTMTRSVDQAGRSMYRGYGTFGLSAQESATIGDRLTNAFYPGGKMDPAMTHGFTAGQMGNMLVTLQKNNMLGGLTNEQDANQAELGSLADSKFGGNKGEALAAVNADALKTKMKDMSKVFQVAREITGSEDMDQLLQAIQVITGGAAGKMSASEIEGRMSRVQEITRAARMSMDQMMYLITEGSKVMQNAGFTAAAGAATSINSVETATIMSAQVQRAYGGTGSPYGMTDREVQAEAFKQDTEMTTSPMNRRFAGIVGTLDTAERTTPGVIAANRKKLEDAVTAGKATAEQKTNLQVLQAVDRIKDGQLTPDDYKLLYGEAGTSRAATAISSVTGQTLEDARFGITSQANQSRAMAEHGDMLEATREARIIDQRNRVAMALTGSAAMNGVLDQKDPRRAELANEITNLQQNTPFDSADYRTQRDAVMSKYKLSGEGFDSLYTDARRQSAYLFNYNSDVAMTTRQVQGASVTDRKAFSENIDRNVELKSKILAKGGGTTLNFSERFMNLLMDSSQKDAFQQLLGGVASKDAIDQLSSGYDQLSQMDAVINSDTTDDATKQKLIAQRRDLTNLMSGYLAGEDPKEAKKKLLDGMKAAADTAASAPKPQSPAERVKGRERDEKTLKVAWKMDNAGQFHRILGLDQKGNYVWDDKGVDKMPEQGQKLIDVDPSDASKGTARDFDPENDTREAVRRRNDDAVARQANEAAQRDKAKASPEITAAEAARVRGGPAVQGPPAPTPVIPTTQPAGPQAAADLHPAGGTHIEAAMDAAKAMVDGKTGESSKTHVDMVSSDRVSQITGTLKLTLGDTYIGRALLEAANNAKPGVPTAGTISGGGNSGGYA